ncbi:MAG: tripartite tricarboxylate transporter substrate binding protein [Hyphomicrobiales bacterium]|nr:tripartite tricarboxylate transporter substrate binding protein [Hyphomicrobiales bacterium]
MGEVLNGLLRLCVIVALAPTMMVGAAAAQTSSDVAKDFPSRAIRIVVPFPAGGPTDINARIIAQKMSEDWKQPVIIENRPGALTALGAQVVAKADPDGYTLLAAMDTTLVMNPATSSSLIYDPFKDFATVTLTASNTSLLTVRASGGPRTVKELIAFGRANPGKLNYGAGVITTRLAGYLFARMASIDVQLIPYKGSADTVQGLLSGSVDFIVDGIAASLPLIKSGELRALAKLNSHAQPALPEVEPLAVAAGLPALEDISTWIGLVAPAGTPPAIVDKLYRKVVEIYRDPVVAERLVKAGITPVTSTPAEFDAFFRKEAVRWTKVFRESGIKLD